jgi:tRNA dimethylallyltransferase
MMKKPCLVVIAGPTAVGKTAVAIKLALSLNTEIISADSRQIYHELTIGTAKPVDKELAQVKHHFINHISIQTPYNANKYEHEVLDLLNNLFQKKQVVIMAGGSGLYIDAVLNGIPEYPSITQEVREVVVQEFDENGIAYLQNLVKKIDAPYYQQVDKQNPRRLMHAIEVYRQSGKPYSYWINQPAKKRPFNVLKILLNDEREQLYRRINERVDDMFEAGLEEEAKRVYAYKNLSALKTVGYRELFEYFEGRFSLEKAKMEIKKNSRRYAKRQLIWFRKRGFTEHSHSSIDDLNRLIQEQCL